MKSSGFTLVELLVTISIFIIMTALIVARYGAFNQGTLMTNLAYDVALSIRTAQTYGVSVKGVENIDSNGQNQSFSGAYGVDFNAGPSNLCDPSTSDPTKFIIFSDTDGNNHYLCTDTVFNTYNLKQGAKISALCVGMDGQSCSGTAPHAIDITFKRPDPSAVICVNNGTDCAYNYAMVTISSADNTSSRNVIVRGNGQISVGN